MVQLLESNAYFGADKAQAGRAGAALGGTAVWAHTTTKPLAACQPHPAGRLLRSLWVRVVGADHPGAFLWVPTTPARFRGCRPPRRVLWVQITLIKQEKVACLTDNDAHLALEPSDPYTIQTKPHGHGDVHALLHSSGLAAQWKAGGFKWVCFFQVGGWC